jgi:hypothetical protein
MNFIFRLEEQPGNCAQASLDTTLSATVMAVFSGSYKRKIQRKTHFAPKEAGEWLQEES